jgi:hypothetical protein
MTRGACKAVCGAVSGMGCWFGLPVPQRTLWLPRGARLTRIRRSCQAATGRGSDGGSVRLSWLREPGVWWGKGDETDGWIGWPCARQGRSALHPFLPPGNRGRRDGAFGRFLQAPGVRACSQKGFTRRRRWRRSRSRVHPNKAGAATKGGRDSGLRSLRWVRRALVPVCAWGQ